MCWGVTQLVTYQGCGARP